MSHQIVAEQDFVIVANSVKMDMKHFICVALRCIAFVETHAAIGNRHTEVARCFHRFTNPLPVNIGADFNENINNRLRLDIWNGGATYMSDYRIVISQQS